MTVPDAHIVEAYLARLDTETLVSLVVDAWTARGFETDRDGDVVVATRDGASVVLWVVGGGRDAWLRRATPPDYAVDVVVAPRGRQATRTVAEECGARVVDATALHELLWYGVDRPTATAIYERYFGASPDSLRPPASMRVRQRLDAVERPNSRLTFLVAVFVVALLVGVTVEPPAVWSDGGDVGEFDGTGASTTLGDSSTTAEGTAGSVTAESSTDVSAVPGVTEDGIENLTALATAHEQAVTNRSYTLWFDVYEPRAGDPTGPPVQRDIDIAVEGDRYFLVTESEIDGNRTRIGSVYHDGDAWFVGEPNGANTTNTAWRRVAASDATAFGPNPFVLGRTGVSQFLSTPTSAVRGTVDDDDRTLYRLVGRGRPAGVSAAQVTNYTVVALVDPTGLVVDLSVDYTVATTDQPSRVRLEWTYGRLDETTVDAPPTDERPSSSER
jgi:hypothetical protein